MTYSKTLLQNIYWAFNEKNASSQDYFVIALKKYYANTMEMGDLNFDLDEIILESESVVLQYVKYLRDGDFEEPYFKINADKSTGFSAIELLYKINKELYPKINKDDTIYFEGLQLQYEDDPDHPGSPAYHIVLGS